MQFEGNFSPKAQFFIKQSKRLAESLHDSCVKEEHLLLIILQSGDPLISLFLEKNSIDIYSYIDFVISFGSLNKHEKSNQVNLNLPYSESFKNILAEAVKFSHKKEDDYISIQHLYFALINNAKGSTYNYIISIERKPSDFVNDFINSLKIYEASVSVSIPKDLSQNFPDPNNLQLPQQPMSPMAQDNNILENFCVNLNSLCESGDIQNVIGRDQELERICEILARKNKNNPLLIGDPGVGKTACAEALALLVTSVQCPRYLEGQVIYAVDLASMIAGPKYRGQFEQRIKNLIAECSNKDIILFIDEAHTLVGAGSAEGSMDAANILKPALARGSLKIIAATTYPEYKNSIQKDSALSRRFQNVFIDEPSDKDCIKILNGISSNYEDHHGVIYSKEVINHIIKGAKTYLPTNFFPDKAIDLMDEAGAKLNLCNSKPTQELIDAEMALLNFEGENPKLEQKLMDNYDDAQKKWSSNKKHFVSINDVNEVISFRSKLPLNNIFPENYFDSGLLKNNISRDLFGQDNAVSSICKSIARSQLGLKEDSKPIGSFLFLGSTGTGKTFCAKSLAKHYFGDDRNLIRFDMSEFSEKVSSSKLIGASPGYVGYEQGGLLIEKVRKNPHSILLFDEIEKAHRDVQQLLLQVLEEGELEVNSGYKAYFHNTIIILTSNIGSHHFNKTSLGFSQSDSNIDEKIKSEAMKILSPELFNRIDDVVIFDNLSEETLGRIFYSQLDVLKTNLSTKNIKISINHSFKKYICNKAKEANMGGRPIKRLIKKHIENIICDNYSSKNDGKLVQFYFSTKSGDPTFSFKYI